MTDPDALHLRTTVNGQPAALAIPAGTTLAELLRERLGLTGTKVSCAMGICGACSVLVDGRTVSACTTLAADVEGAEVTTVEGLATGGALSALQDAFIRHGALQCGYCTPGFLTTATELLARNPAPDEAAVVTALEGNICRCTGYRPIIAAVLDAAGTLPAGGGHGHPAEPATAPNPAPASAATGPGQPPLRVIGTPVPRVDARAKVTGSAGYVGDLAVPGLLHAAVVRSDVPHGTILGIDSEAALAVPGVLRVLIFADLAAGLRGTHYGPVVRDCPLLADGVVRYEGEPVALVIAEEPGIARRAARLVRVDIEDLPRIVDVSAAQDERSPRLHHTAAQGEFGGAWADGWQPQHNIAGQYHDQRGDVNAGFAKADRVFTHEYSVPTIHHAALENQVATAIPGPGSITIHGSNQYPYLMSKLVGDLIGLPESSVRVVIPYVGGSFGGKEYASVLPLCAAAAWIAGRPVRLEYSQEESFRTAVRHAATMKFTSGVTHDGLILARKIEILFDTGAYADQGPRVVRQAGYRAPGPYRIPNLQVDAYAVYTNKVPAGAYRGFGASQPIYACESHMDEIALGLGLDPVELRRRNLLGLGDDFVVGDLPLDCDLPEQLRIAEEEMARPLPVPAGDRRVRAAGYAIGLKNTASGNLPSTAIVRLHADGSATVLASSVEIGQGTLTMLAMVVAETLGIATDRVRVTTPDTAVTPFDQRTSSSRSTVHLGVAAQRAAQDAARRAIEAASRVLDVPADGLRLSGGIISGGPKPLSIGALLKAPRAGFGGEVIGVGDFVPESPEAPTSFGMRAGYWEGSVGAAQVAVDTETGEVELLRYVTVSDVGRVINPLTAHGQEEGGAVMAFGHALFEASLFEDGAFVNPSLVDYRVPRTTDVPSDLTVRALERGDGPGPFGAKGLGESSIITVAPAIANAVAAATGVRIRDLPLNAWTVWRALQEREPE